MSTSSCAFLPTDLRLWTGPAGLTWMSDVSLKLGNSMDYIIVHVKLIMFLKAM